MKVNILSENYVSYVRSLGDATKAALSFLESVKNEEIKEIFNENELNYSNFFEVKNKAKKLLESCKLEKINRIVFGSKKGYKMAIHEAVEASYCYLALCEFEDTFYKESLYVHSQAPESVIDKYLGKTITIGSPNNMVDIQDTKDLQHNLAFVSEKLEETTSILNKCLENPAKEDIELIKESVAKLTLIERIIEKTSA